MNDAPGAPDGTGPGRCPSAEELAAWDGGYLSAEETERIAEHLDRCPRCGVQCAVSTADEEAISWTLLQSPANALDEPDLARALASLLAVPEEIDPTMLPDEARESRWRSAEAPPSFPDRVGSYVLLRPLGRGAMGWVFEAEHVNLRRRVALKLLPPSAVRNAATVARFYQEMAAVGKLSHPHIVQAFDAGEADGHHYLAMELVSGCDASQLVKRLGPFGVADACEIARQVALALKHAHANGLVHRDVKPSNVMVTLQGQVKLLDLGLATIRAPQGETDATSAVAGTAEYMAPEQWDSGATVDARADHYALGCMLYKLLTGATPFAMQLPTSSQFADAHRHAPIPAIRALRSEITAELEACVERLLAKQPADRPATAGELAQTLARFSPGADLRSLVARAVTIDADADTLPPSQTWTAAPVALPRPARPWRRIAALVTGLAALAVAALYVVRLADRGEVSVTVDQPGATISVDGAAHRVEQAGVPTQLKLASGRHTIVVSKQGFHDLSHPAVVERGKHLALNFALEVEELIVEETARWMAHESGVKSLAISPDGRSALSSGDDGTIRLWDLASRTLVKELLGHSSTVHTVVFSADGKRAASAGEDHTARLWDLDSGRELARFAGHQAPVLSVAISHDGKRLATGSFDKTFRVWDVHGTECLWSSDAHVSWVRVVKFSHDDRRLLTAGNDTLSIVWDARTGRMQRVLVGQNSVVLSAEFSADAARVLTGGYDREAILWDVEREERMRQYFGHAEGLVATWTPDEQNIVTASLDGELRYWSVDHDTCLARFVGHQGSINEVKCLPDGGSAISAGVDGTLRIWTLPTTSALPSVPAEPPATEDAPPETLASVTPVGPLRQWQASDRTIHALTISNDGQRLLSAGEDRLARLWNIETGEEIRQFVGHDDQLLGAAFTSDDRKIATAGKDQIVRVWNAHSGELVQTFRGHTGWVTSLGFMAGGPWLLSASVDGTLRTWDIDRNEPFLTMDLGNVWTRSVAFSPRRRNSYAVSGGHDSQLLFWEIGSGATTNQFLPERSHLIAGVDMSPNARLAAAVGWSGRAEIWDLISATHLASLAGHVGAIYSVAFTPDNEHIVTAGEDCTVRLWNVREKVEVARFTGPTNSILAVDASLDGRFVAAAGWDGKVFVWPLPRSLQEISSETATRR